MSNMRLNGATFALQLCEPPTRGKYRPKFAHAAFGVDSAVTKLARKLLATLYGFAHAKALDVRSTRYATWNEVNKLTHEYARQALYDIAYFLGRTRGWMGIQALTRWEPPGLYSTLDAWHAAMAQVAEAVLLPCDRKMFQRRIGSRINERAKYMGRCHRL
jgi:hypothetical protein